MEEFEALARQLLGLPLEQRAALAGQLLESLDHLTPEELEQLWAAEAQRRYEAYEAGKIESYSGPEVHRQILEEIK